MTYVAKKAVTMSHKHSFRILFKSEEIPLNFGKIGESNAACFAVSFCWNVPDRFSFVNGIVHSLRLIHVRQTCPVGGQIECSKLTQLHVLQWQEPCLMAPWHLIIMADGEVGSNSVS